MLVLHAAHKYRHAHSGVAIAPVDRDRLIESLTARLAATVRFYSSTATPTACLIMEEVLSSREDVLTVSVSSCTRDHDWGHFGASCTVLALQVGISLRTSWPTYVACMPKSLEGILISLCIHSAWKPRSYSCISSLSYRHTTAAA